MKSRLIPLVLILVSLGWQLQGCKKDDASPTSTTSRTSSFSFKSSAGNFSASGTYNPAATSGSGAGWMSSNIIAAYTIVSPTNVSVVTMGFSPSPSVGTFNFPVQAAMSWALNINPNDTASIHAATRVATTGNVVVTAHGNGTSEATFGGTGALVVNATDTCSITEGKFTIYSTGKAAVMPPEVQYIVRRLIQKINR